MPCDVRLTWHDTLELAAALAGLTRVRSRFLPFGAAPPWPKGGSPASDAAGLERTTALARAGLYNFLAVGFAEPPTAEFTDRLVQSRAPALLAEKGLGGDDLRQMGEACTPDERAADLARAYTRLLVRPGPESAPPLASEYLAGGAGPLHPLSLGTVAEAAEAAYREAGLVVSGAGPYPPQHLAIELQFMHHCAARQAAAWGEDSADEADLWRERQLSFLTAHLLPWMGAFYDRVTVCGAHPYYRALAGLTASFLASDARLLAKDRRVASPSAVPSSPSLVHKARDVAFRPGLQAG
jgi:TorA-specific chaperone